MIPLEKQCVSLELVKRLKELGVKQESFWAWYETTDRDDTPCLVVYLTAADNSNRSKIR